MTACRVFVEGCCGIRDYVSLRGGLGLLYQSATIKAKQYRTDKMLTSCDECLQSSSCYSKVPGSGQGMVDAGRIDDAGIRVQAPPCFTICPLRYDFWARDHGYLLVRVWFHK